MANIPSNPWTDRDQRRFAKAFHLLPKCNLENTASWADLGCGQGYFSGALAHLLGNDASILALDLNQHALASLKRNLSVTTWQRQIHPIQGDVRQPLPFKNVDGLVLANVLHFFSHQEKAKLLDCCGDSLDSARSLILVEYNSDRGNPAVPFPLTAEGWLKLLSRSGWHQAELCGRVKSSFLGEMIAIQAYKGF